ncbi:MAG: hypothetical protein JNK82_29815 [Myxococcaceae bacterium]|nr:hypothetical protein [Myxococcaceae bacterium]
MPPHHSRAAPGALARILDRSRIDALLAPWLPDAADRAFVVRCVLDEGPAHHRGANYVLLALLGQLLEKSAAGAAPAEEPRVPVPLHLPPHLREQVKHGTFPLGFPARVLDRLAPRGSAEQAAMVDCVTDGPPQHALANAAMLCVLDALLSAQVPK